jgi:sigma-B regulation protein RsbU (phosphoserine phosphatase)
MTALPIRFLRQRLGGSYMPKTVLARLAVILIVLELLEWLIVKIARVAPDSSINILFAFTSFLLICVLLILAIRWLRRRLMWRLRNRLIVTYVFIGVIPLLLLTGMAVLAGYLFAGQFSAFVVTSDLRGELRKLQAANSTIASEVAHQVRHSGADRLPTRDQLALDDRAFSDRHVTAWYKGKYVILQGDEQTLPLFPAESVRDNSIIIDEDQLFLRAVTRIDRDNDPAKRITVISSVPLDTSKLLATAADIGVISLYSAREKGAISTSGRNDGVHLQIDGNTVYPEQRLSAGIMPGAINRLDFEIPFGTIMNVTDWNNGKTAQLIISIRTRPSLLYGRLFRSVGEFAGFIVKLLFFVAIVFAIIELIALIIGIRLTRTMTKSVASLYEATQHINAADFRHRIKVTSQDQLAALETSFNSMTSSLEQLIAEQKEKQRIESELAIAQEVQALLFPRDITEVESLEVHGICKPARTVSGDYYDFLPVGPDRLGIAVGDISGKGISAALLMATVHAFVRAYTLVESIPALATPAAVGATPNRPARASIDVGREGGDLPPGTLLSMLNSQLYRSTPTEKYATMFLGFYDEATRKFNYSNAGHLPPFVIGTDGSVQKLDTGGLVVGLFGDVTYPDDSVDMRAGDIFVAYSDGITEPENEFGEFGEDRLVSLIQENRHLPLARISDIIIAAVVDWIGGNEQPDDITLVLARAR